MFFLFPDFCTETEKSSGYFLKWLTSIMKPLTLTKKQLVR